MRAFLLGSFFILLALKLIGILSVSWWIVFSPMILFALLFILAIFLPLLPWIVLLLTPEKKERVQK